MHRLAILAAIIAIPMMAQNVVIKPTTPNATETKTFALQSGGKLKIDVEGNIKISAWDKEEVALAVNYAPGNNVEYLIMVDSKKDSLGINYKYPPRRAIRQLRKSDTRISPALFDMELKVPNSASCDIGGYYLGIELNGVSGNHKLRSSKGNIEIKNINGNIDVSGNGNIILNNVNGRLYARSWNGNIFSDNLVGDTITLNAQ